MADQTRSGAQRLREILLGRILLLAFGLGVLGYLVAIDRTEWFSIRPATGTSIAMANASAAARDNQFDGTLGKRP